VEDNALNQQLALELLQSQGVAVDLASNGQEALQRLKKVGREAYDAVLMDLQMPVMDGFEATRQIRTDCQFQTLPIIAMTAHAMDEERQRCLAAGMNAHVSKPIEPEVLYATLGQHFSRPAGQSVQHHIASERPSTDLPTVSGLDTTLGLRRCGGNVGLYRKLLSGLVADYTQAPLHLQQLLEKGHWTEGERMAHTLKGLAGSLGATDVQALSEQLERGFKTSDADAVRSSLVTITADLNALLASLGTQLGAATDLMDAPSHIAVAPPACLEQLRDLLCQSDGDSIELWGNQRQAFVGFIPVTAVLQISTALENIDFDKALELLNVAVAQATPLSDTPQSP
jgi:CheY-like chemotaxis protein